MIVGRTVCGKTTFVQNLAKDKLFGQITEVYWVSKIELSKEQEESIEAIFEDQEINFHYLNNYDYLIDVFKRRKPEYVNKELGKKMILDKLIVMEDVSGLADRSDEFANFLAAS